MQGSNKQEGGIFITEGTEVILHAIAEDIHLDLFMGGKIRKLRVNGHVLDYDGFLRARGANIIQEQIEGGEKAEEVPLEGENGNNN